MIRINTKILHYNLSLTIIKKRARRGSRAPKRALELVLIDLKNMRAGSRVSRLVRHVLERGNLRAFLGRNLMFLAVISGVAAPTAGGATGSKPEVNTIVVAQQPLSTEVLLQYPVEPPKVNQGYRIFHPGVDFEGITGDPVKPIMKGVVVKTEKSRFAYGNQVVVDHNNGYQSMYAHLSKIHVESGDNIDTRSVLGEIGATGRASGDHLHLEVYKDGKTVNPLTVLPR